MSFTQKDVDPLNPRTVEYYQVPATAPEFTQEDLEKHLAIHNPMTAPEYFSSFSHMGLDYVDSVLVEETEIAKVRAMGQQQKYRVGYNKEAEGIKADVKENGYDVRKKGMSVVIDDDDNITDIFSGNTIDSALVPTNISNRIVHRFRKNIHFSYPKLTAIGVFLNNLEKLFGLAAIEDLRYALKQIHAEGGFGILKPNATFNQQKKFAKKCKTYIAFMQNIQMSEVDNTETDRMINDLIQSQLKEGSIISITNYAEVLKYLAKPENGGYVNTPTCFYDAMGAYGSKVFFKYGLEYFKRSVLNPSDPEYFDFDNGVYNMIVHFGTPNPVDPIKHFFVKAYTFWKEYVRMSEHQKKHFYHLPVGQLELIPNGHYKLLGAFQPSKAVEELNSKLFGFGKVISFSDIVSYYEKHFLNNGTKVTDFVQLTASESSEYTEDKSLDDLLNIAA